MSVDNIFSSKMSEMYHNEQWCMTHNGNVISITNILKFILLMKEHNKKSKVRGYQYPVMVLPPPETFVFA